jgi:ADP-ribosylglycohydrolase
MPRLNAADVASRHFPKDPLTIVPLALTLAILMESAEEAILLAANIGGDSDSVASIAGAILGARYPDTVNDAWFRIVETVNGHNLVAVAESLAVLRV